MSTITGVLVSPERVEVIKARVARGTARLDEVKPDWRGSVNVAWLDMVDPHRCVLGQAFGSYSYGLYALDIMAGGESEHHGFLVPEYTEIMDLYPGAALSGQQEECEILTELWVEEIDKGKGNVA